MNKVDWENSTLYNVKEMMDFIYLHIFDTADTKSKAAMNLQSVCSKRKYGFPSQSRIYPYQTVENCKNQRKWNKGVC